MAIISLDVVGRDRGGNALLERLGSNADKASGKVKNLTAATDRQADAELKLRAASVKAQQTEQGLIDARSKLAKITADGNATVTARTKAELAVQAAEVRHATALRAVEVAERGRATAAAKVVEATTNEGRAADRTGGKLRGLSNVFGLFRRSASDIDETGSAMRRTEGRSKSLGAAFASLRVGASGLRTSVGLATSGVTALALALAGVGIGAIALGVKTASGLEQAQIGFTTMLGSAKAASKFLAGLQKFAAATPFEFPQLVAASQRLIAMGIAAKDVIPFMRGIGDAVAGLGGGPELIDQVTTAIGQMAAKGKIQSDELLQLTEAGIPALKILASAYGVSTTKMQDMITKGKVLSDDALPKLIAGLENGTKGTTKFGGMMAKQAQSMAGLWSTLKDNVSMSLANMITPFIPQIKAALSGLISWTSANGPKIADFAKTSVLPKFKELIQWFREHKTDIAVWFVNAYAASARYGAGVLRVIATVVTGFGGLLTGIQWVLDHIYTQVINFLDGFSGLPVVGQRFKDAADSVRRFKQSTDDSIGSAIAQGKAIASGANTAADAMDRAANKAETLSGAIKRVPSDHKTLVTAPGADSARSKMDAATRAANGIPQSRKTDVRAPGADSAASKMSAVTRAANGIPGRKEVVVHAQVIGIDGVQRQINAITGKAVSIQVGLIRGVGVMGHARGTNSAPPGWAWVGERGPELMRFRGGEQVVDAVTSRRAAGARGFADGTGGLPVAATTQIVNINLPAGTVIGDPKSAVRVLRQAWREVLRSEGRPQAAANL